MSGAHEQQPEERIALFQKREVRRTIHENEWWFVITDVVAALTDSVNPKGYFTDIKRRDPQLAETLKGGGNLPPPLGLPFETAGGRQQLQCWNTEGIFRLIQSIPSPKAEPFKRWLAKVGYERIQEIETQASFSILGKPKVCQIVAGGRSEAKTTGQFTKQNRPQRGRRGSGDFSHPFRVHCCFELAGGIASLNPRLLSSNLSGCREQNAPAKTDS